MRRVIFLAPVFVFAAMAVFFLVTLGSERTTGPQSPLIGKPAPAFALDGIEGLAIGGLAIPGLATRDLAAGKVTVLNVFASWCAPCRIEHPLLTGLAGEGVEIVGINYKDKPAAALEYLGELGNPYVRIGADRDGRVGIDWGITGVPETFVIDGNGIVVFKYTGPLTPEIIRNELRPAIARARKPA